MRKAECVDCPDSDEQSGKGDLANEKDTKEENCEKGCDDWHEFVEFYPVKNSSSNSST